MPVAAAAETPGDDERLCGTHGEAMKTRALDRPAARIHAGNAAASGTSIPSHISSTPIQDGKHHPGSSGYYQYGIGRQFHGRLPARASRWESEGPDHSADDRRLQAAVAAAADAFHARASRPEHRGRASGSDPDRKARPPRPTQAGHGSGSFATEVGVNVQHIFLLDNGRLLRARFNFLQRFWHGGDVEDRSVYGTGVGFRGRARPGDITTFIAAVEYSVTREWVLAFDVTRESTDQGQASRPLWRRRAADRRSAFPQAIM